jgi:hypothetical protein
LSHQTRERWLELLGEFGTCDVVTGAVSLQRAAQLLRSLAAETQFEPEDAPAPLTVIDPERAPDVFRRALDHWSRCHAVASTGPHRIRSCLGLAASSRRTGCICRDLRPLGAPRVRSPVSQRTADRREPSAN